MNEDILNLSAVVGVPAELIDSRPVSQPSERKLATVQRIVSKSLITKDGVPAQYIEQVQILGWSLVANIDQFQVGDMGVFFEIDSSFDPELPWVKEFIPFMDKHKWRVKTMQLKNFRVQLPDEQRIVVSQGLVIPIAVLKLVGFTDDTLSSLREGDDVTAILGVKKYEAPVKFNMGDSDGDFPYFIPKTDEKRVQGNIGVLEELRNKPYYMTVKMDGTSGTFWMEEGELKVASRNNRRKPGANVYWNAAVKYGLAEKLARYPNLALQGEIYGTGIQGNRMGETEQKLAIFNVFDRNTGRYVDFIDMQRLLVEMNIPSVEVLEAMDMFDYSLEQLESRADALEYRNGTPAEGVVIRSRKEGSSNILEGRMSFKCISKNFLLKHGE